MMQLLVLKKDMSDFRDPYPKAANIIRIFKKFHYNYETTITNLILYGSSLIDR